MSGTQAIVEKIISDAKVSAEATLEQARATADAVISVAEKQVADRLEKSVAEYTAECEEMIRRKKTMADLEVKKITLAKKQSIMAKAVSEAVKAIKSDRRYSEYLKALLRNADSGDVVWFSESDKSVVNESWLTDYAKKTSKNISFGGYRSISGGVYIEGKKYDKNLSLDADLAEIMSEHESEIAVMIFGEK